jgi:hypothetical protein
MKGEFTIREQSDSHPAKEVKVRVEDKNGVLLISPEGYGDKCSEDGRGTPVAIEIWQGELRIIAWTDINREDPQDVIGLEGAREDLREEEDPSEIYGERIIKVRCGTCKKDFNEQDVEFLNIEEDIEGRDVMTFKCPDCGESQKSLRRG